jgi:hypothetical protein
MPPNISWLIQQYLSGHRAAGCVDPAHCNCYKHSSTFTGKDVGLHVLRASYFRQSVCPQPLTERVPHRVRSIASSFKIQYLTSSLRSSSSCLRFLLSLLVPSIIPSITCSRRQFLHKIWPIQLDFFLFILHRMFLYITQNVPFHLHSS